MSKMFQKYPTPANTSCNDTVFSYHLVIQIKLICSSLPYKANHTVESNTDAKSLHQATRANEVLLISITCATYFFTQQGVILKTQDSLSSTLMGCPIHNVINS